MKSKITFFLVFMLLHILVLNAQVGIGTTSPDPSSVLDITSTDSGLLIPRMTESDKNGITSPAQGLMVYQTDGTTGFYYFDGSWQLIGANDEDWTVSGNNVYPTSANRVGIGNTSPTSRLSITSDATTDAISVDAASFLTSSESTNNNGGGSQVTQLLSTVAGTSTTQTFIAEDSGFMTRVSVVVQTTAPRTFRLSLRDSGGTNLASTTFFSEFTGLFSTRSLNIASGLVPITTGTEYQIHLELLSSGQLLWRSSTNNNYTSGSATNSASNPNVDMYFSTAIENNYDQDFVVNAQGNVGVGTSSPSATLDVAGTFRLRDNGASDGAYLVSDVNGNASWQTQEAPIAVTTFSTSYAPYGSSFASPSYYIDRGRVYIQGLTRRSSSSFVTGETIFTLPVGYRPSATHIFACMQGNEIVRIDVSSDGRVSYVVGANSSTWVSLSGISFRVD